MSHSRSGNFPLARTESAAYSPRMPLFGENGERIGYRVYAHRKSAPPLLLLHGFTASAASFSANLSELRKHFTVVTVDLLGHGESDAPADPAAYGPERAVARIVRLLDHLGFDRALLCGHSLGGALALRVALSHPNRVAGLVVINSNSAAAPPGWRDEVQPGLAEIAARVRREGTGFLKETRLYPARGSRLPDDARQALTEDFDRLQPEGVAGTAEGLIAQVNAFEQLPRLVVPTLVVIGDRDTEFVRNAPGFLVAMDPTIARSVTLEGAGHAANLEQPEAFNTALYDFAVEIGYLPMDSGSSSPWMVIAGAGLVALGAMLIGASFLIGDAKDPMRARVDREGSPVSDVAGARLARATATWTTSPMATDTATPTPTDTPTATPTPTEVPVEETVLVETPEPEPEETPTPDETPVDEETPADEETPTEEPEPTETPTLPGAFVVVHGPDELPVGGPEEFRVDIGWPPDAFLYTWVWSNGDENAVTTTYVFPEAGCHTVSVTATFSGPVKITGSKQVSVGGVPCD